ncbi:MAG: extracellular solute-binding protein [Planctomycetes bacterium]|nr:extracellular solute-binding protein [Planctomycetota bacterium]
MKVLVSAALLLALLSCSRSEQEVVVYCALDRNFSEPILREFEQRTGVRVRAEFDVEAAKTVGLVRKIEEEANNPRCDVFWNNEIIHTIRLKKQGLLAPYASPAGADLPAAFRDTEGAWHGFAARARVFIVNSELLPDASQRPSSYLDLVGERFRGQGAMAKPLTGTTMTHAAALFAKLGPDKAREFLQGVIQNEVMLTSGNAAVMRQVRDGNVAFGFTDTDDYNVARVNVSPRYPVTAVYPDSGPDGIGTLLIPNTVCMVKGGPNPQGARALVDFLLSREVEEMLALSDSAQIPLRAGVPKPEHVLGPEGFKVMEVDFEKVADALDLYREELNELFLRG